MYCPLCEKRFKTDVSLYEAQKYFENTAIYYLTPGALKAYKPKIAKWEKSGKDVTLSFSIYRLKFYYNREGLQVTEH